MTQNIHRSVRVGEVLEIGDVAFYIRPFFVHHVDAFAQLDRQRVDPVLGKIAGSGNGAEGTTAVCDGAVAVGAIKTAVDGDFEYLFAKVFVADGNSMYGNVYLCHCIKIDLSILSPHRVFYHDFCQVNSLFEGLDYILKETKAGKGLLLSNGKDCYRFISIVKY